MGRTAVIYATGMTKNTKKVAEYIARQIGADIFNLKEITMINTTEYDTIVFGTGIHAGKPYKQLVEYIEKNKDSLVQKRLFLFIECMYNGEKGDAQRDAVAEQLGIQKAVYFNKKADEMNEAGFPKAVDDFIAFAMYVWDKHKAKTDQWRTKESTLLIAALLGPWGAVAGMKFARHKTQKLKFKLVYVFLVLHIIILAYLVYSGMLAF